MGRELSDIHMDRKASGLENLNGVSNDRVYVAPRVSADSIEGKDYEIKECTEERSPQKADVLGVKSTNKVEKPGSQKSSPAPAISNGSNDRANHTLPEPFVLETEKRASGTSHNNVTAVRVNNSPNGSAMNSPVVARNSQPNSRASSVKPLQPDIKKHTDEEDNWSLASSTAASVRTNKSRITVASAPRIRCSERAEKRKEFFSKLEQKHEALKAEKTQSEQRLKEEQEAVIKQLRKTMVFKANPVPSFYHEPPPPKPELKKLPLTRPKSPKLNQTRRKSCTDAVKSPQEKATLDRTYRHSLGSYRVGSKYKAESSPSPSNNVKSKSQVGVRSSFRARDRQKQAKETGETVASNITEQSNGDIAVLS